MHELSIAHAIVTNVVASVGEPTAPITGVRVRIGELSGIVPQALQFAYDVAAEGTILADAALVIERTPVRIQCPTCGEQQLSSAKDFHCPGCGVLCGNVIGGEELEIVDVTLDDTTELKEQVLAKNELLADGLRERFTRAHVSVSNWVSSPGTGKTALLEAMLTQYTNDGVRAAALVGDCATDNDAQRLARSGAPVRQIVTEGMCHLESDMVASHLEGWNLDDLDVLVIENVGNLVCPTAFDLGEDTRVALLSVTEGEDKPVKYPQTFHAADLVVITKIDLAEAVEWDREAAYAAIRSVNPNATIIETSSRRGDGITQFTNLLLSKSHQLQEAP